jgi:hypothetical protein
MIIYEIGVAIAVVIGLLEVVKIAGLPTRFVPLSGLILGSGISFLFPAETIGLTILSGLVIGLSACGLYSGVKTTVGK